mmetsp:Transcript_51196/g.111129  ORF Transcript_51196/g.111129 Transcript_51196/m.111129 type:complete len:229 (-) Transcript_51196:36-722(-)
MTLGAWRKVLAVKVVGHVGPTLSATPGGRPGILGLRFDGIMAQLSLIVLVGDAVLVALLAESSTLAAERQLALSIASVVLRHGVLGKLHVQVLGVAAPARGLQEILVDRCTGRGLDFLLLGPGLEHGVKQSHFRQRPLTAMSKSARISPTATRFGRDIAANLRAFELRLLHKLDRRVSKGTPCTPSAISAHVESTEPGLEESRIQVLDSRNDRSATGTRLSSLHSRKM